MHHLVERGGQGNLVGGNRSVAVIRGLEDAWIADHLVVGSGGLSTEPNLEMGVLGEGAGEPGHRGGDPLIAAHHRLDCGVFGPNQVREEGLLACAHNESLSHGCQVTGCPVLGSAPAHAGVVRWGPARFDMTGGVVSTTGWIILIVVLLILFGGGFGWSRRRR